MKKTLLILLFALSALSVCAQDWDFGSRSSIARGHRFGFEAGITNFESEIALDLGFRWQYDFHEYISWDVVTLKALAQFNNFDGSLTPEILTGLRLFTPEFIGMRLYGNAGIGYDYNPDTGYGGLALQLGIGLRVTDTVSIGYAFDRMKLDDFKVTSHGLCVAFLF